MKNLSQYTIIILLFILIFLNISPAKSTTLVYDTIDSQTYKTVIIKDFINIKNINEYEYSVYLNNSFYGNFKQNEQILVPNGSEISIYVPTPIKTDLSDVYGTYIKPTIIMSLGFMFTWGLPILIIGLLVYRGIYYKR